MNALPCGYVRTGKLREHIAHYRSCGHPFCRGRLQEWDSICAEAQKPGAIRKLVQRGERRFGVEEGTRK
jgi:hypothetical protein